MEQFNYTGVRNERSRTEGLFSGGRSLRSNRKTLPRQARGFNRSLILQKLYHDGSMSRADLAGETSLTRVTVSDLVAELISDGFITEQGVRESAGPGKPAILIDINHTGHRIIGVDLSGTDVFRGAVFTLDGACVIEQHAPFPKDKSQLIQAIIILVNDLITRSEVPVLGVGIGVPGIIDDHDVVVTAPNLGWADVDLNRVLSEAVDLPVHIANDANAAVLAEYTFGGAADDVLLVRIGQGLGVGVFVSGHLVLGGHYAAGEIGHVTLGDEGSLETLLSVPALSTKLENATDTEQQRILADAGELLGIALGPVAGVLDVSEIVLAGPADLLQGVLIETVTQTLRERTLLSRQEHFQVRMATQVDNIVVRGAAVMVLFGKLGVF